MKKEEKLKEILFEISTAYETVKKLEDINPPNIFGENQIEPLEMEKITQIGNWHLFQQGDLFYFCEKYNGLYVAKFCKNGGSY